MHEILEVDGVGSLSADEHGVGGTTLKSVENRRPLWIDLCQNILASTIHRHLFLPHCVNNLCVR